MDTIDNTKNTGKLFRTAAACAAFVLATAAFVSCANSTTTTGLDTTTISVSAAGDTISSLSSVIKPVKTKPPMDIIRNDSMYINGEINIAFTLNSLRSCHKRQFFVCPDSVIRKTDIIKHY